MNNMSFETRDIRYNISLPPGVYPFAVNNNNNNNNNYYYYYYYYLAATSTK
jgi:hypothetical protein